LASLQAMSPTTARRYTTPPPDLTRYKLLGMERNPLFLSKFLATMYMHK
jgi:hypothetical protein